MFTKRLCTLTIALLFSAFSLLAQHLEFKGVPIDGKRDSFVSKMEQQGYKVTKNIAQMTVMEGEFTGRSCKLYVVSTRKTDIVWKILVDFVSTDSWSDLKSQYKNYKEMFSKKYGTPTNHYEFFSKPYYEGDGYELQALRKDKCTYVSYWETTLGNIVVEMDKSECLEISYEDASNVLIMRKEKEESNLDEI